MAIEKRIQASFHVENRFDETTKVAGVQFPPHVPPEIENFVRSLVPDARFAYIHVVAMTDGDRYGSNLNGDTFSWDDLTGLQTPEEAAKNPGQYQGQQVPRYKTFEQAKFFRHHDNQEWSPSFGDVPVAAINEPLRRVELIIRVARQPIPELGMQSGQPSLRNYDSNGFFCVSMGSRIHHERCSICGNENEFVHQRCPHLANQMNQILPDGRQVTASNHGFRFFDISDVDYNPADSNALMLAKVASAAPTSARPQPNHAQDVGARAPWRDKASEIEKHLPMDAADCVAPKVAPIPAVSAVPEIAAATIKAAVNRAGIDSFLSTATAMGIVLSPFEFFSAVEAAEPEKAASIDADFGGFRLSLDNLDLGVYDALASSISSRSGFVAPCAASGWEPSKIADAGYPALADYYAFYRASLGAISQSQFEKTAYQRRMIRELVDAQPVSFPNVLHHLAYAGIHLP